MPKPLKKPLKKRVPAKDENQLAHALVQRLSGDTVDAPADFEAQFKAHMAKLGAKGGKISGERRMSLPLEVRRRVASIAARAMWAKRKGAKKR